jgi:hypothetical protein
VPGKAQGKRKPFRQADEGLVTDRRERIGNEQGTLFPPFSSLIVGLSRALFADVRHEAIDQPGRAP